MQGDQKKLVELKDEFIWVQKHFEIPACFFYIICMIMNFLKSTYIHDYKRFLR